VVPGLRRVALDKCRREALSSITGDRLFVERMAQRQRAAGGVATLDRAVNAVGAAAVMFYAQFGYTFQHDDEKRSLIRSIFTLKVDHGIYPTACYIPNADGGTKAWDWELLDCPFPPA